MRRISGVADQRGCTVTAGPHTAALLKAPPPLAPPWGHRAQGTGLWALGHLGHLGRGAQAQRTPPRCMLPCACYPQRFCITSRVHAVLQVALLWSTSANHPGLHDDAAAPTSRQLSTHGHALHRSLRRALPPCPGCTARAAPCMERRPTHGDSLTGVTGRGMLGSSHGKTLTRAVIWLASRAPAPLGVVAGSVGCSQPHMMLFFMQTPQSYSN